MTGVEGVARRIAETSADLSPASPMIGNYNFAQTVIAGPRIKSKDVLATYRRASSSRAK
jgi:hypothetical protein